MKITKILVALSFLFAVSTAQAGEMTVTGSMQATYQSESERTTGNPLGMDRELKFSGSTELDNGMTVTVMQDTSDALAFADGKITFGNVAGMMDIYVGADGSELDAIDDITPSAFEEANGSGSGTYKDIGTFASEMGIGFKASLPIIGTVSGQYIPKVDSTENADKSASGDASASVGSGMEIVTKTSLGDVPFLGMLDGNTLTLGYGEGETSTNLNTSDAFEATVALTGSYGAFSYGFQREHIDLGQTAATTDALFYRVDSIGLAYAVNDALSISYNIMEQKQHNVGVNSVNNNQETDAINIGYTVGGLTLGFQDASTDHANHVTDASDDTRTISVKAAF